MSLFRLWESLDFRFVLIFVFVLLLMSDTVKNWIPRNFPPGPWPLPFLGNIFNVDSKQPHIYLTKLAEHYGDVYSLRLGQSETVVVNSYKMVKEALVNQAHTFSARPFCPIVGRVTDGLGLVMTNGHMWKRQRRFALTTLRNFGVGKKTLESTILEEIRFQEAIEKEQGKVLGEGGQVPPTLVVFRDQFSLNWRPFDPHFIFNNAVSNVICSLVFGHRFEYGDGHFQKILHMIFESVYLEGSIWATVLHTYSIQCYLGLLYIAASPHLRDLLFKSKEPIASVQYKQQREEIKQHRRDWDPSAPRDYIDCYLGEIEKAEIDRVIGQARQPSMEGKRNMPYTDAVIHEVQRMGNVAPLRLPHMTTEDTMLGGYFIPKGHNVIPNLTSVLFDKNEWQTPDTFNPGHFLDAEGQFVRRDAFLPFSVGKRACLGEQLARMELLLFLTSFLQKFTFSSPEGVEPSFKFQVGNTLSPQDFKICAIRR
ncbi:cytochrome P450 2J2-like [Polyodon spathula]|uniref:cytochrome P450 2J2-like n=1 Tax=Polyodon spathula TaxID=7913 RepID=UPI001B7DD5DA|nr:cytochrome P450 2J2-like [Polyodon spathula]